MQQPRQKLWIGLGVLALSFIVIYFSLYQKPDASWKGFWLQQPVAWQGAFRWQYSADGSSSSNPLSPQAVQTQMEAFRATGVVTVTVLEKKADRTRLRFSLHAHDTQPPNFTSILGGTPIQMEAVYGPDGILGDAFLQPDSNPLQRSLLREMAYDFQLSWSLHTPLERTENVGAGEVTARLTESEDRGQSGTIVLNPRADRMQQGDDQMPYFSADSQGSRFWTSDKQGLSQIEVQENWNFEIADLKLGSQKRQVRYERLSVLVASLDAMQVTLPFEKLDLDPRAEQKILLRNMDRRLVGDMSVGQLKAKVAELPDTPAGETDKDLYLLLKAYLRLNPEQTAELCKEFLLTEREESRKFQLVLDALTYAGTEASHNVMMESVKARNFEGKESLSILASLGLSPHGSTQVVSFLEETIQNPPSDDVFTTAVLALGSAARSIGTSDQKVVDRTYENLKKELGSASTDESKRTYLAGLGNLGHDDQLETARPFIDDASDVKTQVDAVRSLRFSMHPDIPNYVLQILERPSTQPDVQRACLDALQKRRLSTASLVQLQAVFWGLQDQRVLEQALTLIRSQLDAKEARPFLTKVREEHWNSDVRKHARDMILLQE